VIHRGAQGVARGSARCASQVLDRGAQAVARGATRLRRRYLALGPLPAAPRRYSIVVPRPLLARCASPDLDRGAKALARGAARCASHNALAVASLCIVGT
jgi:hypothetical protein